MISNFENHERYLLYGDVALGNARSTKKSLKHKNREQQRFPIEEMFNRVMNRDMTKEERKVFHLSRD